MSENITTNFTLDWISVTFPSDKYLDFIKELHGENNYTYIEARPQKGYNRAIEYETGLRVSWHEALSSQGVHAVFTGSTLRRYETTDVRWTGILACANNYDGRTSRVDLAFDVRNTALTPEILCKPSLRPYKGKGRTPKFNTLLGGDGSWTLYIGARSSEKMLRIYDKAKEQKDYESDYVRIELETKGKVAHAVGWNFARQSVEECVGMALGLVKGVADFNVRNWDIALKGEVVGLSFPQGKERDTMGWLTKIVAPALAKQIAKRPSDDVMSEFWNALKRALAEYNLDVQ